MNLDVRGSTTYRERPETLVFNASTCRRIVALLPAATIILVALRFSPSAPAGAVWLRSATPVVTACSMGMCGMLMAALDVEEWGRAPLLCAAT